ncbi:MAG: hypothetical protein HQ552_11950 [Desulfobacteraceae bacterium]|nr:hypothetical protein [Desulfobacteraceae bacterium]
MPVEKLDKRFGVTAVEKGFITSEQLFDAMKLQIIEDLEPVGHRLLGEILLDEGSITAEQISEVLEAMEEAIKL